MGLPLFFLPKFPGAIFIQGATFIPDSRVVTQPMLQRGLNHTELRSKQKFPPG